MDTEALGQGQGILMKEHGLLFKQHFKETYSDLELSKHNDLKRVGKAASSKIKQSKMMKTFFLRHPKNVKNHGTE